MARMPDKVRKYGGFTVQLGPDAEGRKAVPWHNRVVRRLLAAANECRVFGADAPVAKVLKRIGSFRDRTWQLDLSKEVIRGSDVLWNSGDHDGIVIVTDTSAKDLAPIFAATSLATPCPGICKTAASYCKRIVRGQPVTAFLLYSISNAVLMDVFVNRSNLPRLFAIADRNCAPDPEAEKDRLPSGLRLGTPKPMDKVTLKEALRRPIWVNTYDEVNYDEEYIHPVISKSKNVTQWLIRTYDPIITFKVEGADLFGTGGYDHEEGGLDCIALWKGSKWTDACGVKGLNFPLTLVSIPRILGRKNVRFILELPDQIAKRLA